MQHVQRDRARELAIGERHRGGVSLKSRYVGAAKARGEIFRCARMDFESRDPRDVGAEQIGGQTVAGAEFQHLVAQMNIGERGRNDEFLKDRTPLGRAAQTSVYEVHCGETLGGEL